MTTEPQQPEKDPLPAESEESLTFEQSRRRFTKAGLTTSGVIVTLSSRSVLGACANPVSPSGFTSGNVSQRGVSQAVCGPSPGFWKNHTNWPSPIVRIDSGLIKATKFSQYFDCTKSLSLPYANITMLNLLSHQSFDTANLGMHCVAAYLNALAYPNVSSYLPVSKVVQIFNQWAATGYFHPIAGNTSIKWDASAIVVYLTTVES